MLIPRQVFSFWLSEDGKIPLVIAKCLRSQIFGYSHHLITLGNCLGDSQYVQDAITAKSWVNACDMLKMIYLDRYGGLVMDADMEILPNKNFDSLLDNQMFAAREENGFVGYSLVGAVAGHPLVKKYIDEVESKFTGDDDRNFESSMEIFTKLAYADPSVKILAPDYWFPYNHQLGTIKVTENTIGFHHFYKSWKVEKSEILPFVSIIIPQLGRPKGLQRCLDSIDRLYYPKHLIEVIVEEGDETVPVKVKRAYEKSKGDIIVYGSNDIEFESESLYNAVIKSKEFGLIAFNTGELLPDNGNICEHFLIRRDLIPKLENGEIFSTDFHHVGCDNWLWTQAGRLNQAIRLDSAIIHHYHFSKGFPNDEVYAKGWSETEKDRELLKQKIAKLII